MKKNKRTVCKTDCRFCPFKLKETENVDELLIPHLANHFRPLIAIKGVPVLPITRNFEQFELWKKHLGSKTDISEMIAYLQNFALRIDQKQGGF